MSAGVRVLLVMFSVLTLLYMIRKIRHSKLQIEYAIFWLLFAFLLLFMSLFPQVIIGFAHLLGIQSPINFVFLCVIFVLMLKIFMMTIELSQLENKVKELTQKLSLEFSREGEKAEPEEKPEHFEQ